MRTSLLPRLGSAVLAALMALPLLATIAPLAPPAQAAPASFTIEGGGWGHGVGLSQYGAYGLAKLEGWDHNRILTHYYTGTSVKSLGESVATVERLWVNLEREATAITLRPATAGSGVATVVTHGDITREVRPGDPIVVQVSGSTPSGVPRCRLTAQGASSEGTCKIDVRWDGNRDDPTTRLVVERVKRKGDVLDGARCTMADWNTSPTTHRDCIYSRGVLHIRPDDNSASFHLVAAVAIDDYVLGISEMPYAWGTDGFAALEAQAVAARSYAVRRALDRGDPKDRPSCWCHVFDTPVDQRYVGWGHSGPGQQGWLDAVRATAGEVVTHPGERRGGDAIPIPAFYSSSTFGRTEPSAIGFGTAAPYLVSVDDSKGTDPAISNPAARWDKTVPEREVARRLGWPSTRRVATIEISECSPSGAASLVRFRDESGDSEVRSVRSVRALLGLRSPQIIRIDGASPCSGPPAAPGAVAAGSLRIDDDGSGDSVGNSDGTAQCAETVELRTSVNNGLNEAMRDLNATIETDDPLLRILHNTDSSLPNIAAGGAAANDNDWDIAIAANTPRRYRAELAVRLRGSEGAQLLRYELPITCVDPADMPVKVTTVTIDDDASGDSVGDGDNRAECGETVELRVHVTNTGDGTLRDVTGALVVRRNGRILHNATSSFPDIAAGAKKANENDFDIRLPDELADNGKLSAWLTIDATGASGSPWRVPLGKRIGCKTDPDLAVGAITIDDGVNGDSRGNLDRAVQCGERIELYAEIVNNGAALSDVVVSFVSDDPYLTVLYNGASAYPDLAAGATATNLDDWDLAVADAVPDGHAAKVRLRVLAEGRPLGAVGFSLPLGCPGNTTGAISVASVTVDDGDRGDSSGDGDRVAECGELIELYVRIRNDGPETQVVGRLDVDHPAMTLLYNDAANYGTIRSGGSGENLDDWDLRISGDLPSRTSVPLRLRITAHDESVVIPIELAVRCG